MSIRFEDIVNAKGDSLSLEARQETDDQVGEDRKVKKDCGWIQNFRGGSTNDVAVACVPHSSAFMSYIVHNYTSVIIHAHQETDQCQTMFKTDGVILPLQDTHDFSNERFEVEYMFLNL